MFHRPLPSQNQRVSCKENLKDAYLSMTIDDMPEEQLLKEIAI